MLSSVRVLQDTEARMEGASIDHSLQGLRPRRLMVDLGRSSLRRAVWVLPVLDAILDRFSEAAVDVIARPVTSALLGEHVRCTRHLPRAPEPGPVDLVIDLSPGRGQRARLVARRPPRLEIPAVPVPGRREHRFLQWIDGALRAGLHPRCQVPKLRLSAATRSQGRRLARTLAGAFGGPLVVFLPSSRAERRWGDGPMTRLAEILRRGMGARAVQVGGPSMKGIASVPEDIEPPAVAALLALAAVCVGDDCAWAHVAAASAAPVVMVHGPTDPVSTGPACDRGVAVFATGGGCDLCCEGPAGRRCLSCVEPQRVAEVAERLAAKRWPWDRLRRFAP